LKKDHDVILRGHHLKLLRTFYFLNGEERIRKAMTENGYSEENTDNTINVLKRAVELGARVKIAENIDDDICSKCDHKIPERCILIRGDMWIIGYLGFEVGEIYSSKYILERLDKKYPRNQN